MGNFLRISNLIFAKFYLCKKALKTRVFSLFLLEKHLVVKFLKTSGGFSQKLLPVVHGDRQAARRRRAVALACPARRLTLGRRPHRAHLAPRPLNLPPPLSVRLPDQNPTAAVIRCRHLLAPRLAVLRPPLDSSSSPLPPGAVNRAGTPPTRRSTPSPCSLTAGRCRRFTATVAPPASLTPLRAPR